MTQSLINFINPLTLLTIPLLGCIAILIYPSNNYLQGSFNKYLKNTKDKVSSDIAINQFSISTLASHHGIVENKEIILKKIALITSFINLLLSILM
jgi:hypothetical protein